MAPRELHVVRVEPQAIAQRHPSCREWPDNLSRGTPERSAILSIMRVDVPVTALPRGFVNEPVGTHTSRTLMLKELARLFAATPPTADAPTLKAIAVDHNALEKSSASGRAKTFRHLRELYGMDPRVEVFRALRIAWRGSAQDRPLLAALCAMARDPVFRGSAPVTAVTPLNATLRKGVFSDEVRADFPAHYSEGVVARVGRNIASSWTQSGHFVGRVDKRRMRADHGDRRIRAVRTSQSEEGRCRG